MPASDIRDGYSEYIFMNDDLQNMSRDMLYELLVHTRAAIRSHRDYGPLSKTHSDDELYQTCLPENMKKAISACNRNK